MITNTMRLPRNPDGTFAARGQLRHNPRSAYDFYVFDTLTGRVEAGYEYREDAQDELRAMIDEGAPRGRLKVLTAAGVRRIAGRIIWGNARRNLFR